MSPQLARLDAYFAAGGSLTLAEALALLHIGALSQRAGDLRRMGKPVVSVRAAGMRGIGMLRRSVSSISFQLHRVL